MRNPFPGEEEESSLCTAAPGEKSPAVPWGRPHLPRTVPRQVLEAMLPIQLHVLLLRQQELHPVCLPFSQGTAGPGWGLGAALLCPALQSLLTLQLCWQQLCLCSTCGSAGSRPQHRRWRCVLLWQKWCDPRDSKVSEYKGSATCPVLFLEPCLGGALLQKIRRIFTVT